MIAIGPTIRFRRLHWTIILPPAIQQIPLEGTPLQGLRQLARLTASPIRLTGGRLRSRERFDSQCRQAYQLPGTRRAPRQDSRR